MHTSVWGLKRWWVDMSKGWAHWNPSFSSFCFRTRWKKQLFSSEVYSDCSFRHIQMRVSSSPKLSCIPSPLKHLLFSNFFFFFFKSTYQSMQPFLTSSCLTLYFTDPPFYLHHHLKFLPISGLNSHYLGPRSHRSLFSPVAYMSPASFPSALAHPLHCQQ